MNNLPADHPDVDQAFVAGFHVVRKGERYLELAGLSTDLVIEQVLMRSRKTTGGLTRGSGESERQHVTWLLSTPACAKTSFAIQELAGGG